MNSKALIPKRWILVLGLAILLSGVILLTLRFAIFSLTLIIIGVALSSYWLFGVVRLGERDRQFLEDDLIFQSREQKQKRTVLAQFVNT
jgi:hypothetical protein